MNILKYLTPLFIAPAFTFSQSAFAQNNQPSLNQKLTMYAKPAVVRIVSRCEGNYLLKDSNFDGKTDKYDDSRFYSYHLNFIGTGFLINPNGYIVTSSRVTESHEDCKQGISRNIINKLTNTFNLKSIDNIEKYGELDITFGGERENGERQYPGTWEVYLPYSPNSPLANQNDKIFEVKHSGRKEGEAVKINKDVAILKVSLSNAPVLKLGESSKVKIQDPVIAVGYPNTADFILREDIKLTEQSYTEASVQEGRISNPNKELEGEYPVLQVDIRAAEGSAGSPLINQEGEVVGMLAFNDSDKDSVDDNGRSVPIAIPTSTLQEFIRQSGAINEQGDADKFYRQGLQNFWKGNFQEAKANFINVRVLFPIHSEIERLISEIDQIEASRLARPWTNPAYIFAFALVIGGGIVGIVAYFLLKQRPQLIGATAGSNGSKISRNSVYTSSTNYHKRNGKGKKCFVEMEYKGQIQRFQLHKDELRLGRDPNWSDFDIPSTWEVISRRHAIFQKEGNDYRLYDGDRQVPSRNGVWITDDYRVDSQDGYLLNNGDRLKIGQDAQEQVLITYFNPNTAPANPKTTMAN